MGADWTRTSLGEVAMLVSGGTPSKSEPTYWHGSTPWVSAKDMKRFRLFDTEDHVTDDGVANGTRLVSPGTTLLLTRGMTLLKNVPICVVGRPMTFNQDVKALLPKDGLVGNYLPYLLLGARQKLLALVDLAGHGTGRLNTDELRQLPIALPSPEEQRRIAAVLGALDDRIELNRQMTETLEAIAITLFHGWFVDELALPNWAAPDSWSEVPLGELVIEQKQKVDPLKGPDTVFEHYSLPAYDTGSGPALDIGQLIKSSKTRVPVGSILVSRLNPRIPRVWLTDVHSPDRAIASTEFLVLTPRPSVGRAFTYLTVSSPAFQQKLISMATGTSGSHQRVRPAAALAVTAVRPETEVLKSFGAAVEPLLDRRLNAERQNRVLAQLRDALLPKLISGEVRIPDAKRMVSEVT